MSDSLVKAGKYLGQATKLMTGIPDYNSHVEHMRVNHPGQTPMTHEEFFCERQDARYGEKGGAHCCQVCTSGFRRFHFPERCIQGIWCRRD